MFEVNLDRVKNLDFYNLTCGYHKELISNIKELSSDYRNYDPEVKQWSLKAQGLYELILKFKGRKDIFFKFPDNKAKEDFLCLLTRHKTRIENKLKKQKKLSVWNEEILEIKSNLSELTKNINLSTIVKDGVVPFKYQLEGAYFAAQIINQDRSCLLAMDLGTGKSLTSLLATLLADDIKKVLFIVKADLRLNIQNEVHKFTNEKAYVLKTTKDKKNGGYRLVNYRRNKGNTIEESKFIITNYEYFQSSRFDCNEKILPFKLNEVDLVIFDEAHQITNKKANRTVNIKKAFDGCVEKKIALTGTPVKNNVMDFFPLLKFLKPDEFTNQSKFYKDYCGLYWNNDQGMYVPIGEDTTNFEGLYQKIQTFTFRVKKEDVLKDLPPILINKIVLDMTSDEEKQYKEIEEGLSKIDWNNKQLIDSDTDTPAMVVLTHLRMFTALCKQKKIIELIKELNGNGEKVILFDFFKKPLYALEKELGYGTKIYSGDQTAEQKQDLVDEFQNKNSDLKNLLVSLMAGNAGITLTESSNVIQSTQSYVPSENSQAYARSHRIGQLSQVMVYILIMADTIDEEVYDILQEKEKVIKAVVDGEEHVDTAEVSVLSDVFKRMKQKYKK